MHASREGGVLTVTAQALGLWRGSYVACVLGPGLILWMVVMISRLGADAFKGETLVLLIVLGSLGFFLTYMAFDLGRAFTQITVDDEQLTIARHGLLGVRRKSILRDSVTGIRLGEAWFTMGNNAVVNLQIDTGGNKPITRLTNYPEADVKWAAAVLAEELGLRGKP
jgi:hypothetical protein